MPDIQSKLFKRVEEMFFRLGIRNLTMDDVARELGISKKTLYQHVENKDDLVKKVMLVGIEEDRAAHLTIVGGSKDAVDEMLGVARYVIGQVRQIKPILMFDLQRHYPDAWAMMDDFHTHDIKIWVKKNIERGIREGLYRPEVNPEIVASIYVAASANICDERFFPHGKFAFEEVILQFMTNHVFGICSEKGRKLFLKRLETGAMILAN